MTPIQVKENAKVRFFTGDDNPASENSSNHTSKHDPGEPIKEDTNAMPINDCPFESSFEPSGNYSSCPVYEIDDGERLVAAPYPEFYRCRGK